MNPDEFDPERDNVSRFQAEVLPLLDEVQRRCAAMGVCYEAAYQLSGLSMYTRAHLLKGCRRVLADALLAVDPECFEPQAPGAN